MKLLKNSKFIISIYCKFAFALFLVVSFYLLPEGVFLGKHKYIAFIFMLTFSFSMTCMVKNIKDKIILSKTYKTSMLNLVLSILGFSAFQVCGVNASVCTTTVGIGALSAIFPSFFTVFLSSYGHLVIWISVILQIVAIFFMRCFQGRNSIILQKAD